MPMDNNLMLSAAFHEAGHAVISKALGCILIQIEIHYTEERRRWEGSYNHMLAGSHSIFDEPILLQKSAKVAIAGILAQARFLIEQQANKSLRFCNHNDLGAWFAFFRDKSRTDTTPGYLKVSMSCENDAGLLMSEMIDGSLFSGSDSAGFNLCFDQVQGLSHDMMLSEVVTLLDDPRRWNAVDRLAKRLCGSTPTGPTQMRQLSQSEIVSELASGM